jgi:t-SNARE complex subunit (syntaxin)
MEDNPSLAVESLNDDEGPFSDVEMGQVKEEPGENLDQTEFHVTNAADHVEDGNVDTHKPIENQKANRNKHLYVMQCRIRPIVSC